jgi:uncharacterized protein (DUF427 family)
VVTNTPEDEHGRVYDNVVWSYEDPIPGAKGIAGLMCFYSERAQLTVDGEPRT